MEWLILVGIGMLFEAIAIMWAYFEIQIEGPNSWASGLFYTWRRTVKWFSKPITGYHVSLGILAFLLLLLPVAVVFLTIGTEPMLGFLKQLDTSILLDLLVKAFFVLTSILLAVVLYEDFLWNVMNPYPQFGVKDFKKKYPQVGKTWYVPGTSVPIDFVVLAVLSSILAVVAGITEEWIVIFITMLIISLAMAAWRYKIDCKREKQKSL